jgi:Ca2+-binding EF-hand superfamily protein
LKAGTEKHTEEFILREVFREFDRNSNGSLSKTELSALLNKINLSVDEKYLDALIKKLDVNGNGSVEFEEFVHFIV